MSRIAILLVIINFVSCQPVKKMNWPERTSSLTGSEFYRQAAAMKWGAKDSIVVKQLLSGNMPDFLKKFVPVKVAVVDSASGKTIHATYFAAPDYLSIGTNNDWARVNITPGAAQRIADSFYCFLPTRKMVDDIYKAAKLKLEPVPMYAFRDSTPTMWHHHLIIEGQRKGRKVSPPESRGLIAGIKKDVVISGKISRDGRSNRVAIYGWHKTDGKPIQPLYTGHINWWVDYSQGIRLIYRKLKVNGEWMDYTAVLKDATLRRLICDEDFCDFFRYDY